MNWSQAEYLLKGLYLGLLVFSAFIGSDTRGIAILMSGQAGGFVVAMSVAVALAFSSSRGLHGPWRAFLLEHPRHIFAGINLGLFGAILMVRKEDQSTLLLPLCLAGLPLGASFAVIERVRNRTARIVFAAIIAAMAFTTAGWWLTSHIVDAHWHVAGAVLSFSVPFFWLLVWYGDQEAGEGEFAAMSGLLALAGWLLQMFGSQWTMPVLVSVILYACNVRWVLPVMPMTRALLRSQYHARAGHYRESLAYLHHAIQLEPGHVQARAALWEIHKDLTAARIAAEPGLEEYIDPHLCLDRAAALLNEPPTAEQRTEAAHLLDLVTAREPSLEPIAAYWRAVAAMRHGDSAKAALHLAPILDPQADNAIRQTILYAAWHLALSSHRGLDRLVGQPQLSQPGRRVEAIAAVERVLADAPQDPDAWGLKRLLYAHLRESDLVSDTSENFDAAYLEQLGLALITDPQQFRRGAEFLKIAATVSPTEAPRLLLHAANALESHGDTAAATEARERGRLSGQKIGPQQLSEPVRSAYFAILKRLAEDAIARGDTATAIEHLQSYTEHDRSGVETLRTLAQLYESRGDAVAALHAAARGLVYNPKDADLLARRDRYLYSVTPNQIRQASEAVRQSVDLDHCMATTQRILDAREIDVEQLAWARHLTELLVTLQPQGIPSRVLAARAALRNGERDQALQWLEDIRQEKPASSKDEESWYVANRLLGELYLNEYSRPDLAIACFTDFRASPRSGADTLYKLGLAHERLGERAKAARFFEQVTAYEGHPLGPEASEALRRLKEQN